MKLRPPPSLTGRVLGTVGAAIIAVFVLIYGFITYTALQRESGELDRNLLRSARGLAAALEQLGTDDGARASVALFRSAELQAIAGEVSGEPAAYVAVSRRDGSLHLPAAEAPTLPLLDMADGIGNRSEGALDLRLYVASSPRWKVALIDDAHRRSGWLLWSVFLELAGYLLLTLPVVLLPVWLAVRTGLAPLRRLSDQVAARAPGDMQPLALPRSYRELVPLQAALDRLFERVAGGIAREKAFVHDAAHELRTPLAVIGTQAHVLAQAEGPAREAARQQLHGAVERASHLTHQLLRLAQADALAESPRLTVDVMDIARDTLAAFAPAAQAQGTELSLSGPDSALLATDAQALRSIVENLVDNALRYGGPGGAVEVQALVHDATWQLRVCDQGPGIAPEHRELAFERFWRGRAERARGAGLGLAIVREAARSLGGDVALQDGPAGRGCMVEVTLRR